MTALHAPAVLFHTGAWVVATIITILAFWLNFLTKRNITSVSDEFIDKLDFSAHICAIVGTIGVILAGLTGLLDIAGAPLLFSLDDLSRGWDNSMKNDLLAYKVTWSIVALQCYAFAGGLRIYYSEFKSERIFDQHATIQAIYTEAMALGSVFLVMVVAAGGIYAHGESIIENTFLRGFLPTYAEQSVEVIALLGGLLALTLFLISFWPEAPREAVRK
ncbi:MAG: hypothetical protein ACE5OZ_20985 [Candidatus Heimdallarchaeota archaeon]